jgi:hypothetical protein
LFFLFDRTHGHHAGNTMWLLPFHTAVRMRHTLTPRTVRKGELLDWQRFKPIQSEHWERRNCLTATGQPGSWMEAIGGDGFQVRRGEV